MNFILRLCFLLPCLLGMIGMSAQAATTKATTQEDLHYNAKKGEFLVFIATKFAGQFPGITWRTLAKDNNLTDPSLITEGQHILIRAPKVLTTEVIMQAPAALVHASNPRLKSDATVMRNHGQSIGCTKVFDGATFEEDQVNTGDCARISAARRQYALSKQAAHAVRSIQIAQPTRASRVTQIAHSLTPIPVQPEPYINPAVRAMIDEEFTQIKSELVQSFSSAPEIDIIPLAWVILLKRHGVMPDARFAWQSLRIQNGDHLIVSTFPFDRLKE